MRSESAKPRVVTKTVRSPLRSSRALVATVVPMRTDVDEVNGQWSGGRDPEQFADALDSRVFVEGAFRQQLVRE